ncbi:Protein DEHYDRATION-INDUCED 19-like protein 3 [Forsythia ovata]|uniref:Protein DEHYDRATION-INDUCED 19-like protein 3 n=1 Tax=Forsythia ovata TaxID=205694 RepID=A0ABD1VHZ2_9LAMI
MDADSWAARLSSASKRYQFALQCRSGIKSHGLDAEMLMGFDEMDLDDDIREEYPCPFCSEYFDIVGICCHIDDEHPAEAKNGVCPICVMRVGVDLVAHITLQHGNIFKISFSFILCFCYIMRKRKSRKAGSHSTLSLLRRELREGNLQSLFGGSSSIVSSSHAAPDPLLSSFILPMVDDFGNAQLHSPAESTPVKKSTTANLSERKVQQSSLSIKDREEKAKKCEFVQGFLLSTILDDNL